MNLCKIQIAGLISKFTAYLKKLSRSASNSRKTFYVSNPKGMGASKKSGLLRTFRLFVYLYAILNSAKAFNKPVESFHRGGRRNYAHFPFGSKNPAIENIA